MMMRKTWTRWFVGMAAWVLLPVSLWADVKVKDVSVKPRWPWNGLVDITYSIECDEKDDNGKQQDVYVKFSGMDQVLDKEVKIKTLTGEGAKSAVKDGGPYKVTWNAAKDCPNYNSAAFSIKIHAMAGLGKYMVVNLETGEVRYSQQPPDLSNNICRTTELWLREVKPGTFIIGSNFEVTLTEVYYIGVFECTQRQWELVMGRQQEELYIVGATLPEYWVSYDDIRGASKNGGAGWPLNGHTVDATSFMGRLQAKTGMTFDLPTEAQWEVAARGGAQTHNYTYSGSNNVDEVAWYTNNPSRIPTHTVGTKKPNELGLYDMSGNVEEWCLDWGANGYSSNIDPVGPATGSARILRGGGWLSNDSACNVRQRMGNYPSNRDTGNFFDKYGGYGFRIVCLPLSY